VSATNLARRGPRYVSLVAVLAPDLFGLLEFMRYESAYQTTEAESHKILELAEHRVDESRSAAVKVTADNITDEQIREAQDAFPELLGSEVVADALGLPRGPYGGPLTDEDRHGARSRCAAAYNALPDAMRRLTLAERIRWIARNGRAR